MVPVQLLPYGISGFKQIRNEGKYFVRRNPFLIILILWLSAISASAQYADYSKMSSMVRSLTVENHATMRRTAASDNRQLCAFVRVEGDGEQLLANYGCRSLARFGDIHIASIPIHRLASLSLCRQVSRIEARMGNSITMDTTLLVLNGYLAHQGAEPLPQAFTGRGVVVGVQDIGFDLTHPNFYDATATNYRIRQMWDFLSTDTVGSPFYVGADYTTEEALLQYAHSRDGFIQPHGTHTLGCAAGSGYNSPYRGIAPESDICLVSNAVSEDLELVDSVDYYKYTYALDALGFKYMFDYADSVGKPCVVSFSEGSSMDFRGDDQLYYEVLDSLCSRPGHIMVASAGNAGHITSHFTKPEGVPSASTQLLSGAPAVVFAVKSRGDFEMRFHLTGDNGIVADYSLSPQSILEYPDTLLADTLLVGEQPYYLTVNCYESCFDSLDMVVEGVLQTDRPLGIDRLVTVDVVGEAAVDYFRGSGYVIPIEPTVGDNAYSIHSPSSAPSVISVGATGYRTGYVNYLGEYREYDQGTSGQRSDYSSVGPTYDGRIKPDVMAPGTNIISSYSSYYLEAQPEAGDIQSDVEHFEFRGRTYAWNCNSGTSMSTPVVAGAIALWLEARPDLTTEDVLGVIQRTSRHYDSSLAYPNNLYGYGEIDVYYGLLDVLGLSDVPELSHHQPKGVVFSLQDNGLLRATGASLRRQPVTLRVYSTAGTLVTTLKGQADDGVATFHLSSLPQGVYAVQLNTSTVNGSTLIRWKGN